MLCFGGVVQLLVLVLSQIFQRVCHYHGKNFENSSRIDRVINMSWSATFWETVYICRYKCTNLNVCCVFNGCINLF